MPSNLQKHPGSPKQQNDRSNSKPPLPNSSVSQFRKGAYHDSLYFVQSLCDTSYGLVDVFPIEDRKTALCEVVCSFQSLINASINCYEIFDWILSNMLIVVIFVSQSLAEINLHLAEAQNNGGTYLFMMNLIKSMALRAIIYYI